jgi:RND family efflux transporter MFP subunit
MRKWQKALVILAGLALIGMTACSLPGKASTDGRLVTVERGDLIVFITGSGSLATQQEARLSFKTAGKIAEVIHKEGNFVAQGTALARLEADSLALAKKQAEVDLSTAKAALTEAEMALKKANLSLQSEEREKDNAEDAGETLKLAMLNSQISLNTAKLNLEQTRDLYTWSDIKTAKADVDEAQRYLDDQLEKAGKFLPQNEDGSYPGILEYIFGEDFPKPPGFELWQEQLVHAQSRLNTAKDKLEAMLSGTDTLEVDIKMKQVEAAELQLAKAQKDLGDHAKDVALKELEVTLAQDSVKQADQSVTYAEQAVALAQQSLGFAKKNLDEATITAPFSGVIAEVRAKVSDVVDAATMVVHLVQPTLLELIIEIDEMDVPKVATGQIVKINVDALPEIEFTGEVASVYPLPTKVTGLVMYNVKIALAVPDSAALKIGMRATANIIVDKKGDVIKVPSRAVQEDGQGGHFVQVIIEKKVEERPVTVGIDNGTETEIISGLSEGENVIS